ncbi:hypothetical protein ARMGADRAFT_1037802 [Armillaria gallica]|uniref:Uncharacterized protein n=1 Tax=Armillaria gallica TaxID=47427 RepID=A0A2H3D3M4_ARMGA|nr:hypothetical protein ARMGADRAFT_1037802 [Armillaria gallica]
MHSHGLVQANHATLFLIWPHHRRPSIIPVLAYHIIICYAAVALLKHALSNESRLFNKETTMTPELSYLSVMYTVQWLNDQLVDKDGTEDSHPRTCHCKDKCRAVGRVSYDFLRHGEILIGEVRPEMGEDRMGNMTSVVNGSGWENAALRTIVVQMQISHDNFTITGTGQYFVAELCRPVPLAPQKLRRPQFDDRHVRRQLYARKFWLVQKYRMALKHVQHRNKWHMAARIGGEQESEKEDSGIKQAELTWDWDARTSMQVFRQQCSLAMYWERGTEPDIYALGQGNGSIKSKIQAVTRCILEAARKVLSKKKCQTDTAQYEDGESFTCGAGADTDGVGSTIAERDD